MSAARLGAFRAIPNVHLAERKLLKVLSEMR